MGLQIGIAELGDARLLVSAIPENVAAQDHLAPVGEH
jgi:hypothetical protein